MNISVFTDLRFAALPRPTGVSKHLIHMVQGLHRIPGHCLSLLRTKDQSFLHQLSFLPQRRMPLPWKMAEAIWTLTGFPVADPWVDEADWVYCPKNDYIPIRRARVAVTVHGAHELDPSLPHPQSLSARANRFRRRLSYSRIVREANLILTVSEFLKGQVIDWFGASPEKIVVVGNGVEPEFFAAAAAEPGGSGENRNRPFVISVGGLNFLDGGDRILAVAAVLRRKVPDLRILVAGTNHAPDCLARAANLPNLRLLGYVSSKQLALYLRDAMALFYPTRYETFGLAAAEAMAVGTPIVTCRTTAVPEIVGDAALFASAEDPEEMADALSSLLWDHQLSSYYSGLGRDRAKRYAWKSCVDRLCAALARHT